MCKFDCLYECMPNDFRYPQRLEEAIEALGRVVTHGCELRMLLESEFGAFRRGMSTLNC